MYQQVTVNETNGNFRRGESYMEEKEKKDTLPYTCTPAYDRSHCGNCVCATCYEQEFCDHCSSCKDLSHKKESCNSYEGAYCY